MIDRDYKPSARMIELGGELMLAMAWCELISEQVVAYQAQILAREEFYEADWGALKDGADDMPRTTIRITDPARAWLMTKPDFERYNSLCKVEQNREGLRTTKPENCPKLEAEYGVLAAERKLIEQMGVEIAEPLGRLNEGPMDLRRRALDTTLKLLAPYLDRQEILARAMAA